jgi:hypothetical protein
VSNNFFARARARMNSCSIDALMHHVIHSFIHLSRVTFSMKTNDVQRT